MFGGITFKKRLLFLISSIRNCTEKENTCNVLVWSCNEQILLLQKEKIDNIFESKFSEK